jgi:hypothetical protein
VGDKVDSDAILCEQNYWQSFAQEECRELSVGTDRVIGVSDAFQKAWRNLSY